MQSSKRKTALPKGFEALFFKNIPFMSRKVNNIFTIHLMLHPHEIQAYSSNLVNKSLVYYMLFSIINT